MTDLAANEIERQIFPFNTHKLFKYLAYNSPMQRSSKFHKNKFIWIFLIQMIQKVQMYVYKNVHCRLVRFPIGLGS